MALLLLLASVFGVLISWPIVITITSIYHNYQRDKLIGLPIIISPIDPLQPIYWLVKAYVLPIFEALGLEPYFKYTDYAFTFKDRYYTHAKLGPAFLNVSPGQTQLMIADPLAADDLQIRWKEYVKSPTIYQAMELFGPNVDSVNGEVWQRHRRITAPPFNERNSALVWRESLEQATGMLDVWVAKSKAGEIVEGTHLELMKLAMHVLSGAGFGRKYDFGQSVTDVPEGYTMSYRDALALILTNLVTAILARDLPIPNSIAPKGLVKMRTALAEFTRYMEAMVQQERTTMHKDDSTKVNLLSALVRALETNEGRGSLSDSELYGNLFIWNLAGHDTTANTLTYAISWLATDSKWQEWIGEEVNHVLGPDDKSENWEYEKAFPRLKRCLALMFETARLFAPVMLIPKYTGDSNVTMTIAGKEYTIPPRTHVNVHLAAIHSNPEVWGEDSLAWRPDRWIKPSTSGVLDDEELIEPARGTFMPWAVGPRQCPGKKFAQVEFVAVIARLMKSNRVKCAVPGGEQELVKIIGDSEIGVTLKLKHPEKVKLLWEQAA